MSARAGASGSPAGGGTRATSSSSTSVTPSPVLAEMRRTWSAGSPISSAISAATRSGSAPGQVDLVQAGDQLQPAVDGQVGVGHGLRLDALRGVDHQQRALARGQGARHLVGEVHVPGRVDQVQLVGLPVARRVEDAHGLRLDRDPALALEVHGVEQLGPHVAPLDRVRHLQDAVGQRRLPVVDVGDDGEVADAGLAAAMAGPPRLRGTSAAGGRRAAPGSPPPRAAPSAASAAA